MYLWVLCQEFKGSEIYSGGPASAFSPIPVHSLRVKEKECDMFEATICLAV